MSRSEAAPASPLTMPPSLKGSSFRSLRRRRPVSWESASGFSFARTLPHQLVMPLDLLVGGSGDFLKAALGAAKKAFDALAIFQLGVAIAPSHRVDEAVDPFDEEGGVFLAGH